MTTKDKIEQILKDTFTVTHLEIIDETHKHRNHRGVKESGVSGHFQLHIVSPDFAGHSRIAVHRMINTALKEEMGVTIHALAIKAETP